MSIDANPSIKEIATTSGDPRPYSMSEMYGLKFSSGNAVLYGTIRLSDFSNKTVEPLKIAEIRGSNGNTEHMFGADVSISSDGSTIIVGAWKINTMYIFEYENNAWIERAKLTVPGLISGTSGHNLGRRVAISSDGSTAIASSDRVDTLRGAVYVFEKPVGGWSDMTQTSKLTYSGAQANDYFGTTICIPGDGSTVFASGEALDYGGITRAGTICVFEKPATGWPSSMTETYNLTASDAVTSTNLGGAGIAAMTVSSDGSTVFAGGGPWNGARTVYVFEKPVSGWSDMNETSKLTDSSSGLIGISHSATNDGSLLVVGSTNYGNYVPGTIHIFEKPGTGWPSSGMTETAKLTGTAANQQVGLRVSVSGDGSKFTAMGPGAVYFYQNVNGTFIQQYRISMQSTNNGFHFIMSNDGSKIIIGEYRDNTNTGVVNIYKTSPFIDYLENKLTVLPYDLGPDYFFGNSVFISGDGSTAIVGAFGYDGGDVNDVNIRGAAFIFEIVNGTWTQVAKLEASDWQANDQFGYAVSISRDGSTALVGARYDDIGSNSDQGAAYIFEKGSAWSNMTETAKLTTSNGATNDNTGSCVSISDDGSTAIMGATGSDTGKGAVYVFEKGNSWSSMTETAKLMASDGISSGFFGISVSVSGDGSTIVTGAMNDNSGNNNYQGVVYIFEKGSGWSSATTETAKLTGPNGASSDGFGRSVSISYDGSTILAGTLRTIQPPVYIFEKGSGWTTTSTPAAQLTQNDAGNSDSFGFNVSISSDGSKAVVGAWDRNEIVNGQGVAYIFKKPGSGWSSMTETLKLMASDSGVDDNFGFSVSISGDGSRCIVGARNHDVVYFESGGAYIYDLRG